MGWQYSEKTKRLFMDAVQGKAGAHVGEVANADGVGEHGSVACGDALKFTFRVEKNADDPSQDKIVEAKFLTFGCTSAIAASEALCRIIEERQTTPIDALKITNQDIVDFLEGLPTQKIHCSVMGAEALEAAVFDWAERRGVDLAAYGITRQGVDPDDEGRLVCKCFGLTEPYLRRKIRELHLTTLDEVTGALKAGGACGTCRGEIQDILNEIAATAELGANVDCGCSAPSAAANAEPEIPAGTLYVADDSGLTPVKKTQPAGFSPLAMVSTTAAGEVVQTPSFEPTATAKTTPGEFAKLSPYQKAKRIEQTIETQIRPVLRRDGGDVEIVDVKDNLVYVALTGACDGCDSAAITLDLLVTAVLQEQLDPEIKVVQI
ncbi:MAG: iron-sulfur cluster assembly scaffold protein [Thermoguttaceae bacterium]|nr:iron-sulfur cluster assembly scaffold protein [Thermoguttaceae bacterium]